MELLRDGVWQFVGAVLALLAIAITIGVEWKRRQKKELSFFVVSRRAFAQAVVLERRLQVTFEGQLVSDLRIADFGIVNTGTVPIVSADFAGSIEANFGDSAKVLVAEPLTVKPADLKIELEWQSRGARGEQLNVLRIAPLLLNSGDVLVVRCFVVGASYLKPSARIAGIPQLTKMEVPRAYVEGT